MRSLYPLIFFMAVAGLCKKSYGTGIDISQLKNGEYIVNKVFVLKGDIPATEIRKEIYQDQFKEIERSPLKLGLSETPHWFRITLDNNSDKLKTVVIDHIKNSLGDINIVSEDGEVDSIKSQQTLMNRFVTYELPPSSSKRLFFRIQTGYSVGFAFRYWNDLLSRSRDMVLMYSTYMGIAAIIMMTFFFGSIIFWAYRLKSDLVYLFYLFSAFMWAQTTWGISYWNWITEDGGSFFLALMMSSGTLFTIYFLDLKKINHRIYLFFRSIFAVDLAVTLIFLIDKSFLLPLITQLGIFNVVCILIISTYVSFKKKEIHYVLFLMGWSVLGLGSIFSVLMFGGAINFEIDTILVTSLIMVIENLFMILAIAVRVRSSELTRVHSFKQLAKVFYPHQLKHMREGQELESTMRTSPGVGVVISFDIIESSKLDHPRLRDFLESSVHDCMEILSENYSEETMTSNGYRIKEMGDGFICSIGYPFNSPSQNNADLAVILASRFIGNLDQNVEKYGIGKSVYCGIGIAYGQLQGYYPKSGTKEYDLFGRGIVLATRYESMRKRIFPNSESHVLILQTEVFESLSEETKNSFEKCSLGKNLRIRDDPEASELYFKLVHAKFDTSASKAGASNLKVAK